MPVCLPGRCLHWISVRDERLCETVVESRAVIVGVPEVALPLQAIVRAATIVHRLTVKTGARQLPAPGRSATSRWAG